MKRNLGVIKRGVIKRDLGVIKRDLGAVKRKLGITKRGPRKRG